MGQKKTYKIDNIPEEKHKIASGNIKDDTSRDPVTKIKTIVEIMNSMDSLNSQMAKCMS